MKIVIVAMGILAGVAAAQAHELTIFSTPGTYDYLASPDATSLEVTCIGAGGGEGDDGQPGGSGAQMRVTIHAPKDTTRITIGAGGRDGLPGGDSSFGNLVVAYGGGSAGGQGSPGPSGACSVRENRDAPMPRAPGHHT